MPNQPSHSQEMHAEFLAAYDEHADGIFRFVFLKVSDRERAKDLVQETFTRAWDTYSKGNQIQRWKPFLYRIAYNLVVDHYRKRRESSLEVLIEAHGNEPIDDPVLDPEDAADARRIQSAIEKLPDEQREVLLLYFVEGLPPRDIAEVLGISANTVSVRIHRAERALRDLLAHNTD